MNLLKWTRRSSRDIWARWPGEAYSEARYQHRLAAVSQHLSTALADCPARSIHITSLCAGDGRDVIGTLATHPRCGDVRATLVELNPTSVATGRAHAEKTGLTHIVSFLEGDATKYETYRKVSRAEIVLICGTWGHVPPHQRDEMMLAIGALTQVGGIVIWTRGVAKGMARLDEIKSLFAKPTWDEVRVGLTRDRQFAVASYRFGGPAVPMPQAGTIFDFC